MRKLTRRRHQGPPRIRARARRVPAAHHRDEEAAPRRSSATSDDHVREHRHDAVPGPGDGARRAHADRRADRATSSTPTTSSSPGPDELSGTLFVEIDNEERLREWLPKLVGIQRTSRSIWLRRLAVPGVRRGRGAADPRGDHAPRCTTSSSAFTPRAGGRRSRRPGADRRRPSRTIGATTCELDRRAARAELVGGPLRPQPQQLATSQCTSASGGSTPTCRFPPRSTSGRRRATTCTPRSTPHARRRGGGRALVPTGIAIAIPPGYAGFVQPRSGLALEARRDRA